MPRHRRGAGKLPYSRAMEGYAAVKEGRGRVTGADLERIPGRTVTLERQSEELATVHLRKGSSDISSTRLRKRNIGRVIQDEGGWLSRGGE